MRLVCDWDLVIAPADIEWLNWLNAVSRSNIEFDKTHKTVHYDITKYFPDFKKQFGVDPYSFWDNQHLYDTMGVVPNSTNVVHRIIANGANISIASHTKGGHLSSKYRHVTRSLDKVDFSRTSGNGFFATKEKYLLPCDVTIDDRAENLVLFPDETLKIYFNTIYEDPYLEELKKLPNVIITGLDNQWEEIESILLP